jgi:hypothetical protein
VFLVLGSWFLVLGSWFLVLGCRALAATIRCGVPVGHTNN